MKNFIISILIIGVIVACGLMFELTTMNATMNAASKKDLEELRKEFRSQIDSVLRNQDSIKAELMAIKCNTDTLKAGQEIIFKAMEENKNKSFWDFFK